MRELPAETGDRVREPDAPQRPAREFRFAGPGGVEVLPASAVELPEFHLDRRSRESADTPRESLRRFEPERAGLPATTLHEAPGYIRDNLAERPWLRSAEHAPPEQQRVFAALEKGPGHATERHEGEVTSSELRARVTRLEDPAQLDPVQRERSQDAYMKGIHVCDSKATQIWDPDAFATAFARGMEEPRVRAVLERPFDPASAPGDIDIPIAELLGNNGHEFCSGYRLVEVEGDEGVAREQRREWAKARREGVTPEVPEPQCVPIESFEGGTVKFRFRPKESMDGYTISTMYPEPPFAG